MSSLPQKVLVFMSIGVWLLAATLMGVGLDRFWQPLGVVSIVMSAATYAYDKWLWAFFGRVSGVPDLRGTWRGTITTKWTDPKTGVRPGPIEAYFVVVQTASDVVVTMMTAESRSSTINAKMERRDGAVEIVGMYRNEPASRVRERSPIHYGGLRLRVGGPPATSLHGDYWTDRATSGDLALEWCTATATGDYANAKALCALAGR